MPGAGGITGTSAIVKARAVIAAGTVVTGSTPVYDLVKGEIIKPSAERPLVIERERVNFSGAFSENGTRRFRPTGGAAKEQSGAHAHASPAHGGVDRGL